MDIPALSIAMSQANLAQAVSIGVYNLVKVQSAQQGQELVRMMERSVLPHLGGNLDIQA